MESWIIIKNKSMLKFKISNSIDIDTMAKNKS